MAKYTSGRKRDLKVGIQSYSENLTSLEVIGKVGIGTTNASANLEVNGSVILGGSRFDLINVLGSFSSHLYPDGDGLYDIGRASQIGLGANRWRNGNFTGKGVFDSGIDAHDIEIGVGVPNLIYSTYGNLELNAQSGRTNIDDNVTVSGNLGVGTTNPSVKLDVDGDVNISGILTATDINSSSDIRLKKNIKKFENTLEKIDEINGVSFEWKQSGSKSAGIIAQDLEKVFPELVINTSEYKKVNYNGLIGVLVESIKELKQEVQNLKSELNDFKYK
jgi:hypothetical protein